MKATHIVEAVLFASDAPLHASEIARADPSLDEDQVELAIQALKSEYEEADRAFEITHISEGYQLLTRSEFAPYLERFDTVPRPNRLSGPALEALAIIAYRQPIGRIEMEYIRGVSSAGVIRTLVERGLVDVVGRDEGLGRPLLYGTTSRFLEHFGFASLEDLPRPEELPVVLRERVPILPEDPSDDTDEGPEGEAGESAEAGAQEGLGLSEGAPATGDAEPAEGAEAEAAEAETAEVPDDAGFVEGPGEIEETGVEAAMTGESHGTADESRVEPTPGSI